MRRCRRRRRCGSGAAPGHNRRYRLQTRCLRLMSSRAVRKDWALLPGLQTQMRLSLLAAMASPSAPSRHLLRPVCLLLRHMLPRRLLHNRLPGRGGLKTGPWSPGRFTAGVRARLSCHRQALQCIRHRRYLWPVSHLPAGRRRPRCPLWRHPAAMSCPSHSCAIRSGRKIWNWKRRHRRRSKGRCPSCPRCRACAPAGAIAGLCPPC